MKYSTAFHPQTDGQIEVMNKGIELCLRSFVHEKPNTWYKHLGWAEFSYNTSYHASIKMSPFQALFGRTQPEIPVFDSRSSKVQAVEELLLERDALLKILKENLQQAQAHMENQVNKHRREVEFLVGEFVWLKLQPYRQKSVSQKKSQKLALRFFSPYEVMEKIGVVAYRLKLPERSKIHHVFHVSLLKRNIGEPPRSAEPLPTEFVKHRPKIEPMAMCGVREISENGKATIQVLIHWHGRTRRCNLGELRRIEVRISPSSP